MSQSDVPVARRKNALQINSQSLGAKAQIHADLGDFLPYVLSKAGVQIHIQPGVAFSNGAAYVNPEVDRLLEAAQVRLADTTST